MKHIPISENHLYSKAYTKGKKHITKSVIVYVLKDYKARQLQHAHPMKQMVNRIGLTVSKKLGGAIERNRAKRVMREGLRQTELTNTLNTGYLIVIVARPLCTQVKSQEVARDLTLAFSALGLIKNQDNNQE